MYMYATGMQVLMEAKGQHQIPWELEDLVRPPIWILGTELGFSAF